LNLIKCEKLTKKYPGSEKLALNSVDLSIPAKGIFALIGRNGAGKTTLVRILATQLTPTSGTASVDGFDVMREPVPIRGMIAVVPQEARTVGWISAAQQIQTYLLWRGHGLGEANAMAKRALSELGIARYANEKNSSLSGGTKRKVLAAAAIASGAKMLFLDEPTTGLDPIAREELWELLFRLKRTHFIFLTTHYLEEAERLADTIGIMDEGRLLAIGSLESLRKGMRYSHSVRFKGKIGLGKVDGRRTVGKDGFTQVFIGEKGAYELSKRLVAKGISFSINPVSLDDIFYYYVKSGLNGSEEEGNEEEY
jgi:ABC-2 type transport system ATP-binding protein